MHSLRSSIEQTIARPTSSAVVDPLRDILGFPSRVPVGFTPDRSSTTVDTLIDHSGEGIGPVAVSTACNHLFCYTARYEDKRLAVMFVTGDCALVPLSDGRVDNDLALIHRNTLQYGPIIYHSLTTIVTPKSARGLFASSVVHRGQTRFLEAATHITGEGHIDAPPPISLLRVKLSGWLPYETSVPTCTFVGHRHALIMDVAWGKSLASMERIRLA